MNKNATEIKKITSIAKFAVNAAVNKKATETENKTPEATELFTNAELNRFVKTCFDSRMIELEKNLATKLRVRNAVDLAIKNEIIEKHQTFV